MYTWAPYYHTKLPSWALNDISHRVDENMLQSRNADFTKEEIFSTLKQMHPIKALGHDGMAPLFF